MLLRWIRWISVVCFVWLIWVGWALLEPLHSGNGHEQIEVPQGSTLFGVTAELGRHGVISSTVAVLLYEHIFARHQKIYAGYYHLRSDMNVMDLVTMLTEPSGGQIQRLTVVEGETLNQIVQALHLLQMQGSLAQNEVVDPEQWRKSLLPDERSLEGWLAPDTYAYVPGMSALSLVRMMVEHQRKRLGAVWQDRAPDLPYHRPEDLLTMASLVEKETGQADERPHIAGVFVNRLNMHWRLQTDPSVIYGMGAAYRGVLHHQDLLKPSPWNTYQIDGLPPTPISMPGLAALLASAHPVSSKDMYFVARGDGTHVFSQTLAEQNAAIDRYMKHHHSE